MPRARVLAAWVPFVAVLVCAWPAAAFHTVFDYAVERFEGDGNAYGPADGVPDVVDEFDDGSLGPTWLVPVGTAEESGGALHLKNPGQHIDVGYTVDVSEVMGAAGLADGRGDFTISSTWAAIPAAGDFIHMSLLLPTGPLSPDTLQFLNLMLLNTSDGSLTIQQSYGKGYSVTGGESVQVSLSAASAGPVLRIAFDDGTNLATLSLSLDGGVSFMTPFTPHAIFDGSTGAIVLLGADPRAALPPRPCCPSGDCGTPADTDGDTVCDFSDNCPFVANATQLDTDGDYVGDACDSCTTNSTSSWKRVHIEMLGMNDGVPGNETVRLSGVFTLDPDAPRLDPPNTGMHVQLWNFATYPVYPTEIAVPSGMKGASDAGWTVDATGTRFTYDGGAARVGGVRRVTVKQRLNGTVAVKLAAPKSLLQAALVPPPTDASVAFGSASCTQTETRGCRRETNRHFLCDYVWPVD